MHSDIWTVAEAKAKLSKVIHRAEEDGPQIITRNGTKTVVIVSVEEWDRKTKRTGNLADFLESSPLRGSDLKVSRLKDRLRNVDL